MQLEKRVKSIIAEQLGIPVDQIKDESSFIEDLGADSIDIVELLMAFEEEFGVEIPDDEAENIKTVEDVLKHVEDNQGGN